MRQIIRKVKVFISSKIDKKDDYVKYSIARSALKTLLESSGLFEVYLFEKYGSTSVSAYENYTENLLSCDVCVFLIDNADGVEKGVEEELRLARINKIPSLYYFCTEKSKEPTSVQFSLEQASCPKFSEVNSFAEFIEKSADDLIQEVLQTYKLAGKHKIDSTENLRILDNDKNKEYTGDKEKIERKSQYLRKEELVFDHTRFYFANLVLNFNSKINDIDPNNDIDPKNDIDTNNDFDLNITTFLNVIFKGDDIRSFNTNLLIESISDKLPIDFTKIIEKRWRSIEQYYLGNYDRSLAILKSALDLAKDEKSQIPDWLIQDILIDLRNREIQVGKYNNNWFIETQGQKELDERQTKLYYPLIDRYEKSLFEWIEDERQKNDMLPYNTQLFYGDLSSVVNYIADSFSQAALFGSFTQMSRTYSLIQKFSYQLAKTVGDWKSLMLFLKMTLISLSYDRFSQAFKEFPEIMSKISSQDAQEIYEFSSNGITEYDEFAARLIAMSQVGYYLNETDFTKFWSDLRSKIKLWLDSEQSVVMLQTYIFNCLKSIHHRIGDDYLVKFLTNILQSNSKRYYGPALDMLAELRIDYSIIPITQTNSLIDVMNAVLESNQGKDNELNIRTILSSLKNMDIKHATILNNILKLRWPDFYRNEYQFQKDLSSNSAIQLINQTVASIKHRNVQQGENGLTYVLSNRIFTNLQVIISSSNTKIKVEILSQIFLVLCETIFSKTQTIEDKVAAYRLAIFIVKDRPELVDIEADSISKINKYKEFESHNQSFSSPIDQTVLKLSHYLFLESVGKNKYQQLVEILSKMNTPARQIQSCEILVDFIHNTEKIHIRPTIIGLILQNSLMWANSKNVDVKIQNIIIQVKLFRFKIYRTILSQSLIDAIQNDSAFVKSHILQNIDQVKIYDSRVAESLLVIANKDVNYIVRSLAIKNTN